MCAELQEQCKLPLCKSTTCDFCLIPAISAISISLVFLCGSDHFFPSYISVFSLLTALHLPVGCSSSVLVPESFLSKVHFFPYSLTYISNIIFPSELLSLVSPLCNETDSRHFMAEVLAASAQCFFCSEDTRESSRHWLLYCCSINWI